eukprot:6412622-Amphidinium_carterae.1
MATNEERELALSRWIDEKCRLILSSDLKLTNTGHLSQLEKEIAGVLTTLNNNVHQDLLPNTEYEGVTTTSQTRNLLAHLIDEQESKNRLGLKPLFVKVDGRNELDSELEEILVKLGENKGLSPLTIEEMQDEKEVLNGNLTKLQEEEANEKRGNNDAAVLKRIDEEKSETTARMLEVENVMLLLSMLADN